MNVDHLVRLKLPRQGQDMRNGTTFYHRHARSNRIWSSLNLTERTGT
jgi:hypothetical protein